MGVEANSSTDITLYANTAHGQTVKKRSNKTLGVAGGVGGRITYVFNSYKKGEVLQKIIWSEGLLQ